MEWRRSPWLVGVVALALHAVGICWYVKQSKATPDVLMAVGSERFHFPIYSDIKTPLGQYGYDGQFYYAIAHAPFAKYGPEIDFPPGRQLRILFPLLGYVASLGNAAWLPYAMPGVNLLMIGLLAVLGAKWAGHHGLSPWYGLTLPLVVNALMPPLRNLTDTTAMAMAFWLMYATLRDQRPWWVGLAGLAAVLAREQNAALLALVIGHSLWQRRWGTLAACVVAAAVWAGWVWWLTDMYGQKPFLPTAGNFGPPFSGLPLAWDGALQEWETMPRQHPRLLTRGWMYVLAFAAGAAFVWKQKPARRGPALVAVTAVFVAVLHSTSLPAAVFSFVAVIYHVGMMAAWAAFAVRFRRAEMLALGMATGGLLLHVLGGPMIYAEYWAYGRAFFWLPMGLWILAVHARWETALRWAAAAVYFPVCRVLHP